MSTAPLAGPAPSTPTNAIERLRLFFTFFDARFEDLRRDNWKTTLYRDLSAGLIVALTAIPMAMGFAMAMGLRPEQGIIAGALACIVGRTFGGSKYQVYGPTAAFIPVIASLMDAYGADAGGSFESAHGFLVLVSILAGVVLVIFGLAGFGRFAKLVPSSIVVGFTIGIAIAIAGSNLGEVFGMHVHGHGNLLHRLRTIVTNFDDVHPWAVVLAISTLVLTRGLLRVSIFIPAPLLSIGLATLVSSTVLAGEDLPIVRDRFGAIPSTFFVLTPPSLPGLTPGVFFDVGYYVVAIVFISGVESLLCSSMADRLAKNQGTPFNADKELWGQGLVQIITPLVNGFPCTGALARTATSIKAGAVTPLAGYFKGVLKLSMAFFMAPLLEEVPMACIAGILLWVATNMVKPAEVREEARKGGLDRAMLIYTAVMVPLTDFLTGVLSALVIYAVAKRFVGTTPPAAEGGGEGGAGASETGDPSGVAGVAAGT